MAKQQKLDWKSLLSQKPAPSYVTKRSSFLPSTPAPATPNTPVGSNSSTSVGVHDHQAPAIPFLLLPVPIPDAKQNKITTDKPADELLGKLTELKKKAATLVEATETQKPTGAAAAKLLQGPQILPDPLPPPEHVYEPGSFPWYDSDEQEHSSASSRDYVVQSSSRAAARATVGFGTQGPPSYSQGALVGGPSQSGTVGQGDRMATSVTYQTVGSSLITTANSPGLRVQQALARIRQLQHHTQEAFQQGDLFVGQVEEEEASHA